MSKNLVYRIRKKIFRPLWKTRDWFIKLSKNRIGDRYTPKQYWKNRHKKYGLDLRGVGNCAMSTAENEEMYQQAKDVFERLFRQEKIDFSKIKMLDIGCGTGFYAKIFQSHGGTNYLGVDITDQLFPQLRKEFPNFRFKKLDITKESINETFDLIIMIDVTQHIVDNSLFCGAMKTINTCLSPTGHFIVTSWLSDQFKKRRPHEVERPMNYYKKEFPDGEFSIPISFRDKYIFRIRKKTIIE